MYGHVFQRLNVRDSDKSSRVPMKIKPTCPIVCHKDNPSVIVSHFLSFRRLLFS